MNDATQVTTRALADLIHAIRQRVLDRINACAVHARDDHSPECFLCGLLKFIDEQIAAPATLKESQRVGAPADHLPDVTKMVPPEDVRKRLGEIAEREAKATPGPWLVDSGDGQGFPGSFDVIGDDLCGIASVAETAEFAKHQRHPERNAEFIAHARRDVPWLVSQLTAALDTVARLEAERARDALAVAAMDAWLKWQAGIDADEDGNVLEELLIPWQKRRNAYALHVNRLCNQEAEGHHAPTITAK